MRSTGYTDSELHIKDELEIFFWIEIAKRKARLLNEPLFEQMLSLSKELTEWFEQEGSCLDEPIEDGVDFFWNVIQFGSYNHSFTRADEQLALVDRAVSLFGDRGQHIADLLPCYEGFYLAEFSLVSKLDELYGWWTYINLGEVRKEIHAEGLFSSIGERHLVAAKEDLIFAGNALPTIRAGEEIPTTISIQNPVRMPRRLFKKRKFNSLNTDEYEIAVNGHVLSDRFILDFDLSKSMPPMREIELALRMAYSAERSRRMDAMLKCGIIDDPSLFDNDNNELSDIIKLSIWPPEEHRLMVAQNSVRPMIFGLHVWDLIRTGKCKTDAAKQSLIDLLPHSGRQDCSLRQAQYGMKMVNGKIDGYSPKMLPWNS